MRISDWSSDVCSSDLDLFQDMYMSMYMFTGKHRVQKAPDGMTTVSVQAYFRNQMPAGRYPYPFWHSDAKWKAYETSNELRFRMDARGKVLFAYRRSEEHTSNSSH